MHWHKAGPVSAQQCVSSNAMPDDEQVMAGSTMLMTVYANGVGAKRDLDVATHLPCGIAGASMEPDGRAQTRRAEGQRTDPGGDLHVCGTSPAAGQWAIVLATTRRLPVRRGPLS